MILLLGSSANHGDSKAQYVRQFKKWGFGKNSTTEEWKFIARRIRKRALEGKESETYIRGELATNKKIKKEISRHVPPSFENGRNSGNGILSLDLEPDS